MGLLFLLPLRHLYLHQVILASQQKLIDNKSADGTQVARPPYRKTKSIQKLKESSTIDINSARKQASCSLDGVSNL